MPEPARRKAGARGPALLVAVCGCCLQPGCSAAPDTSHPLDPLTEGEIRTAARILTSEGLLGDSITVSSLVLLEPAKHDTSSPSRRASAVLLDRWRGRVREVVLDLPSGRVESSREPTGGQPPITEREMREAIRALETDPRWREALGRRGLTSRQVTYGGFPPGVLGRPWELTGHRFVRLIPHYRSTPFPWAVPVEGLVAVVDVTTLALVEIVEVEADPPPPPAPDPIPPPVTSSLSPLHVTQPDGPSFDLRGHEIAWQGWAFRYALHPREGLVLYHVRRGSAGGPAAPVLARASLAEMVVPYGDPSEAWAFRALFDAGEFGLGRSATALIPESDVPANAVLLDAVLADESGAPRPYPRAIAVFERDGGLLWRHREAAQRARELVVRYVTTVGNYDYGFSWVFAQDGSLAMEIDLTGILMVKGVAGHDSTSTRLGTPVGPGISAIAHQHFFTFRLDVDVGGPANRITELEADPLPHEGSNPHGTGFGVSGRLLGTEREAARNPDPARGRVWSITAAASGAGGGEAGAGSGGEAGAGFIPPRRAGAAPGYVLFPGPFPQLLASPAAYLSERAAFTTRALWVTKYRPEERYPAGEYPSGPTTAGLLSWIGDDESIVDTDIVLWYTTGTIHFPRPEEWPRMPVTRIRFELRPSGFLRSAGPRQHRPQ